MLRLLIVFMLLLPKIASANLPITYYQYGNMMSDSTGYGMTIHQEAIVDEYGFDFRHMEKIERTFVQDFLDLGD